jgi:DNA-binding transcriptional MocR family regulator
MMYFDSGNRVISFGSFSKILAPGLRTGWIHSSRKVVGKLSAAALTFSGGGFNHYASALIKEVIDLGHLESNVNKLKTEYLSRALEMDKSLKEYFGTSVSYSFPKGGYYFWLKFPAEFDSDSFLQSAEENGVSFRPGNAFSESGKFSRYLRLTYTLFESDEIREGVKRLAEAYKNT